MSSFASIRIRGRPTLKKKVCNFMGGVVSPILSNIYMDRLDKFVENTLIPEYMQGKERERHEEYIRLTKLAWYHEHKGHIERAKELRKERLQYPSVVPD